MVNTFEHPPFGFHSTLQAHLSLIKRKPHISTISSSSTGSLSLIPASQVGQDTRQKCCVPLFLSPTPRTSHNISCYLPLSLSSRIKWYCLYTPSIYHPISHFPRLVYLPWGAGETWRHTPFFFSLSSPFAFLPSLLPSNHCWLLVAIDIRGLIKPWRSCLIYAGGVWVVAGKCSKDTSHLLQHLLSYSPGSGEDPARGSFCQLLGLTAHFYLLHPFVFGNKCLPVSRRGWQKQILLWYQSFPKSAVWGSMTACL